MSAPFPDDSDELPESYGDDLIRLIAQSPRVLYLYWRYAHDPSETLRRIFDAPAKAYQPLVWLVDVESGVGKYLSSSPEGIDCFEALPGRLYRAEVGLVDHGIFHAKLSSNKVRTPLPGVARSSGVKHNSIKSAWDEAQVLSRAGYVGDALHILLEAADSISNGVETWRIAWEYSRVRVPWTSDLQLSEMHDLLIAIALGSHYDNLLRDFKSLRNWLNETMYKSDSDPDSGDLLDAARLREVFYQRLGIKISPIQHDTHEEQARWQVIQVAVGSSDVHMPGLPFSLWMPSMTFNPTTYEAFTLQLKSA